MADEFHKDDEVTWKSHTSGGEAVHKPSALKPDR